MNKLINILFLILLLSCKKNEIINRNEINKNSVSEKTIELKNNGSYTNFDPIIVFDPFSDKIKNLHPNYELFLNNKEFELNNFKNDITKTEFENCFKAYDSLISEVKVKDLENFELKIKDLKYEFKTNNSGNDDSVFYYLNGYSIFFQSYLVSTRIYENSSFNLINKNNGIVLNLPSTPYISNDENTFVCVYYLQEGQGVAFSFYDTKTNKNYFNIWTDILYEDINFCWNKNTLFVKILLNKQNSYFKLVPKEFK